MTHLKEHICEDISLEDVLKRTAIGVMCVLYVYVRIFKKRQVFVCVKPKKRCPRQHQTFHAHKQKENYNFSNWPVHQLITVTLVHKN